MKATTQYLLLALLLLGIFGQTTAQTTDKYPNEKVYLHTDRLEYVVGDTIWYKAYLVEGRNHSLRSLSRVLYVSLFNEQGKALLENKLLLTDGTVAGQLALPDSLAGSTVQLVAHTNWMRNQPADFYFRRNLKIWQKSSLATVAPQKTLSNAVADLQFFPESGNLVAGLSSRVAFKATNAAGLGCAATGTLTDENGEVLLEFQSQHLGMGVFTFMPQPNKQYVAQITINGQAQRYNLPKALPQGYVMSVDNVINKKNIRVAISTNTPATGQLHLFAHLRGQLCFEAYLDASKTTHSLLIPQDTIKQQGIVHLTLFDAQSRPLCERLLFVNGGAAPQLVLKTARQRLHPTDSVTVEMQLDSAKTLINAAELSVTVVNTAQTTPNSPAIADIRSYLLLTSDLKGYIEQPNFYFDAQQKRAPLYLDYLLMTHGWRRFEWREILSDTTQKADYAIERSRTITGRILRENGSAFGNTKFKLIFKSPSDIFPVLLKTDKVGAFKIADFDIKGEYVVTAVEDGINQRPSQLVFDEPSAGASYAVLPNPAAAAETPPNPNLIANDLRWQNLLKGWEGGITLQEVKIKTQKSDPMKNDARRIMYGGQPDRTVLVDDNLAANFAGQSVLMMVTSRVPSVSLVKLGNGADPSPDYGIQIRGRAGILMLDGVQVTPSIVSSLNPFEIDRIDVLTDQAAVMGVAGGGGVINILTKRGPGSGSAKKSKSGTVMGYEISRVFFVPNYKVSPELMQMDSPPTLYWNPRVRVQNGKAFVQFTTAKLPAQYAVWVEGLTTAGTPVTGALTIQTKR